MGNERENKRARLDPLTLNCILHGKIFSVELEPRKNISYLRKVIKKEASPALDDVAVYDLRLWKIDKTREEAEKLAEKDMEGPPLEELDDVSEHWPGPLARKRIHVFITKPSTRLLQLTCHIVGRIEPFPVEVEPDSIISLLKDVIKNKAANALKDVAAIDLRLWKIAETKEVALKLSVNDMHEPSLSVTKKVSDCWSATALGNELVHVLVSEPPLVSRVEVSPDRIFAHLYEVFWKGASSASEKYFSTYTTKVPSVNTPGPNDEEGAHSDGEVADIDEEFTYTILTIGGEDNTLEFPSACRNIIITENYTKLLQFILDDDKAWIEVGKSDSALYTSGITGQPGIGKIAGKSGSNLHASVVTGQPGIGKTVFLDYLLVYRLRNRLPTIFCNLESSVHIFTNEGVKQVMLQTGVVFDELRDRNYCALINLGQKMFRAPVIFDATLRKARVVIATSPNKAHLDTFIKETKCKRYCLPTWNWEDLYCASLLHFKPNSNIHEHNPKLREAYAKFSGIPRRCFATEGDQEEFIAEIVGCINGIASFESFVNSVLESGAFPFSSDTSHSLVRIEPVGETWRKTKTMLLSNRVAEMVFDRIWAHEQSQFSKLLGGFLLKPDARGYAGTIFEQAVHYAFRRGHTVEAELLPRGPDDEHETRLKFTISENDPTISCRYNTPSIRAAKGSRDVDPRYLDQYMTPVSKTAESIDSVVVTQGAAYLFQITVSNTHPISLVGIEKIVKALPFNVKKKVYIIFVVPANDNNTKNYKRQSVKAPQGGEAKLKDYDYSQYVCYFDYTRIGSQ